MTLVDAAKKVGVTRQHIHKLVTDGRIPGAIRSGGRWFIPAETDPQDWLVSRRSYVVRRVSDLHSRTREAYDFITAFCERSSGIPPTVREIMTALDMPSTSVVSYHLRKLEEQGYIEIRDHEARGIMVVGAQWIPPDRIGD
jgi:excisionase family DNA binding protein